MLLSLGEQRQTYPLISLHITSPSCCSPPRPHDFTRNWRPEDVWLGIYWGLGKLIHKFGECCVPSVLIVSAGVLRIMQEEALLCCQHRLQILV